MSAENKEIVPEDAGFRVFVGNLSYEMDTDKLREFFISAGEIIDCVAVKRWGRPAGYGFVAFATKEAADAAVALKDTEVEGRAINVEHAVPRDPDAPRRGRGRGRGRGAAARRPRAPLTGEPSKTVLFVGNLPFNVVDEDLQNIFAEYKVAKAHVVRRFNGASRGFGFVTFASESDQQAALSALSEVWCDDRKLIVRAALSQDTSREDNKHEIVVKETDELADKLGSTKL